MAKIPSIALEQIRRLRREEYDRLVALGMFDGERVELLDGVLVRMSQGPHHAAVVRALNQLLTPALLGRALVQIQSPLAAGEHSQPEPDVAILPVADDNYWDEHPRTAHLVIEVADTSLELDRGGKLAIYAAANIPEYWVIALGEGVVEVYTDPVAGDAEAATKPRYRTSARHERGETIAPSAFPQLALAIADFLPA